MAHVGSGAALGVVSGARQEGIPAPSTQQDLFSLFCVPDAVLASGVFMVKKLVSAPPSGLHSPEV